MAMVIIGAGECGARAAFTLRAKGWDGEVVLIGDEPLHPYERPPLSKSPDAPPKWSVPPEAYGESRIDLRLGVAATAIDRAARRVALDDGGTVGYTKLLLATGATARRLAVPPGAPVAYLRSHADSRAIFERLGPGQRAAIIGAGFIGLETAAALRAREVGVTVLEAAPRPLARCVPADLAELLSARHEAEGVALRCGIGVRTIDPDGRGLTLGDGSRIGADLVIVGIGAVPETGLAEAAGLEVSNGIRVDARLQTSDPDIFAAGDACAFPSAADGRPIRLEAWRNALDQGAHAARSMLGATEPYLAVPWFWSEQYDLTLYVAGMPEPGRATVRREQQGGGVVLFELDGGGRLLAASGLGRKQAMAREVKLAEMLIARAARPSPAALADPAVGLKSLLAA